MAGNSQSVAESIYWHAGHSLSEMRDIKDGWQFCTFAYSSTYGIVAGCIDGPSLAFGIACIVDFKEQVRSGRGFDWWCLLGFMMMPKRMHMQLGKIHGGDWARI